jgi:hypothetical protein
MHDHVKGQYQQAMVKLRHTKLQILIFLRGSTSHLQIHFNYARTLWRRRNSWWPDEYVSQWSKSVAPLGLTTAPMSRAELKREIKRYRDEGILGTSETTKRVVEFIRKPPLSKTALLAYDRMFDGAVASIPAEFQEMLGLKGKSLKVAGPITRGILTSLRMALGPASPMEEAAIARLIRIGELPENYVSN